MSAASSYSEMVQKVELSVNKDLNGQLKRNLCKRARKGVDMIVVICVDDKNGMMFHRRRQSQDRVMREDLLEECGENLLHMNKYSESLFKDNAKEGIVVSEDFLCAAGAGEFCFVEDVDVRDYREKIEAVILYKWNRRYPADIYFLIDLAESEWILERTEEFKGSSHERITKEVYRKIK